MKPLRRPCSLWIALLATGLLATAVDSALAQYEFEKPPINYRSGATDNPVARLEAALRDGRVELPPDDSGNYLRSLLDALDIPVSSQGLVFSKTSLQQSRINPQSPRAIYFNDDCYVGWMPGGMIEIAAMDDRLGGVFYTLRARGDRYHLSRNVGCVACHATSRTQQVPGFLVRSVLTAPDGHPRGFGTLSDHRSPFQQRWGGWYVTGTHGQMRHLGNELAADEGGEVSVDVERGANVVTLDDRIDTDRYLSPHSDIVALMVMEHQSQVQNAITQARYETLRALHEDRLQNDQRQGAQVTNKKAAGLEHDPSESAQQRIAAAAERVVEYLLVCDEAPLSDTVAGTSSFAEEFAARGPLDSQGRSLRQFDLQRQLFRYPCSYLVYSSALDALPEPVLGPIRHRMAEVLLGQDDSGRFEHLSDRDRQNIVEILADTKPGWLPAQ